MKSIKKQCGFVMVLPLFLFSIATAFTAGAVSVAASKNSYESVQNVCHGKAINECRVKNQGN